MLGVPHRDRTAERRSATRREILDAAWQLARENGLGQLTLRDVAQTVGMQPPSLYTHFPSKNAIFDAMFGQAWADCAATMTEAYLRPIRSPRATLRALARTFFDFAVTDLARHQLMNQRTIPGFEPSPDSYAPAVDALEGLRQVMDRIGIRDPQAIDLFTALIGGMIDAQQANDPGGDRWAHLLDRAVDMFADHVGLPGNSARRA